MKTNRSSLRLLLIFAICFFLSGCGKSDAEKLVAEAKEVNSWAASSQMISAYWVQDKVPTAYAQSSFKNIFQKLSESESRIESLSDNHRPQLTVTVQRLLNMVSQLEAASKQQNKSAINDLDEQLNEAKSALKSILEDMGETR